MGKQDEPEPAAPASEPEAGSGLPGPFPVGQWALGFRDFLRLRPRIQLIGEVTGASDPETARANLYFELRDKDGAARCAIWRSEFERLDLPAGVLRDGARVVVSGGPDYYPGGERASPSLSFRCTDIRPAGEGDLLAQLERLRKRLVAAGLDRPQRELPRPQIPRAIGVVTGEGSAAAADIRAGLARRGWLGTVVWAYVPVQDRRAASAVTGALTDLAALDQVEVIVVARGGGSLTDLFAFSDETLCRTVALLGRPVISAVGHETDHTLIDVVSAQACSTPTHAAEAAVPVNCNDARLALGASALRLGARSREQVVGRARHLSRLSRAPGAHLAGQQSTLRQHTRELRAATRRRLAERAAFQGRLAGVVVGRAADRAAQQTRSERGRIPARAAALRRSQRTLLERHAGALAGLRQSLAALDPQRTLERGFALVEDRAGEPLTSAAAAARSKRLRLRFSDGAVPVAVDGEIEEDAEP